MIELRWLETYKDGADYFDGRPEEILASSVLQYRTAIVTADVDFWSEWMDVPTVREDVK